MRWLLLALLGLLVAAAVAALAVHAVSGKIGISSEPLSAGKALAPKRTEGRSGKGSRTGTPTGPTTTTTSTAPSSPPSGGDDSIGGGGGGGGEGVDD